MNYSIPPIFTGLNSTQKGEYSYRDRWEKWREHLKKKPDSLEASTQEPMLETVLEPLVFRQKQPFSPSQSPARDAEVATLFNATLLTRD